MHVDIESLLKSLRETIIPAIPASESLAVEQAQLMQLYLKRLEERCEYLLHFRLQELRGLFNLVTELSVIACSTDGEHLDLCSGKEDLIERASSLAAMELPSCRDVEQLSGALREMAESIRDQLVRLPAPGDEVHAALMSHAREEALQERVWNRAEGFGVDPGGLSSQARLFAASSCAPGHSSSFSHES